MSMRFEQRKPKLIKAWSVVHLSQVLHTICRFIVRYGRRRASTGRRMWIILDVLGMLWVASVMALLHGWGQSLPDELQPSGKLAHSIRSLVVRQRLLHNITGLFERLLIDASTISLLLFIDAD
jgi:hypothetical protein